MERKKLGVLALALCLAACGADDMQQKPGVSPIGGGPGLGTAGTLGAGSNAPFVPPVVTNPPAVGMAGAKAPAVAGTPAIPPTGTPVTPPPPGVAGMGATPPPPPAVAGAPAPPPTGGMPPVTPPPMGNVKDPVIPAVAGECPTFRNGTINFMGLGGISVVAGSKAAGPTAPMIFYWHGTGSFSGEYATMAAAVSQGTTSEGGVLISFQGTTGGDLLSGTAIFGKGDFNLTDQLLACAVKNHNIDPKRVFATGCSAGGLFSGAMGTARSNYMAAVAPNSGGWTAPVQWQNMNTPALMTIHGAPGLDVVIIDFSNSSKTADDAYKKRGGFVINCNHGGGHCGGGGLAGDIWKFFKAHPYGTAPSPWAAALPAGFNSKCKIY